MYKDKNGDIWPCEESFKEFDERVKRNLIKVKIGFDKYQKSLNKKKK